MNDPLEFLARVSWSARHILLDVQMTGQPAQHHERLWADVEAWAVGRPGPEASDGVWLLVRGAPHCDLIPSAASGAVALTGELRARGCREISVGQLIAEAERRTRELPLP
ncbi:MAG TPA: hypothetical protein VF021_10135 [Longimicrobiales bacterium]